MHFTRIKVKENTDIESAKELFSQYDSFATDNYSCIIYAYKLHYEFTRSFLWI
ncbi:hypothetical protein UT300018_18290 [Clostridium faecium]